MGGLCLPEEVDMPEGGAELVGVLRVWGLVVADVVTGVVESLIPAPHLHRLGVKIRGLEGGQAEVNIAIQRPIWAVAMHIHLIKTFSILMILRDF